MNMLEANMSIGFERIGSDSQLQDYWLRRLVAFIIDSIIVGALILIIVAIVSMPFVLMALAAGVPWHIFNPWSLPFFVGVSSVLYCAFSEAYHGATLGKRIMNLETTRIDGQKPTLTMAFIRNATKIYWIAVLVDTLVRLATVGDPHQRATDRVAGTIVVSAGASPFPGVTGARSAACLCFNCGRKAFADAKY